MTDADFVEQAPARRGSGRLWIAAAAIMWSTAGFFAQANVFDAWPETQRGVLQAFWRATFACVVLLPMVRRPSWSPRLIPMVLSFFAMNITFLSAMAFGSAANAIWLQYTAPLFVFVAGVWWLKEPAQRRDVMMLAFGMAGVGIILCFGLGQSQLPAIVCGVLSGLFFAGVILSLRSLREFESAWLIALNHLVTAILLTPYVAYHGDIWPSGRQWLFLAGFGILQMGLPYVMFARGLRTVASHEASSISLLEPLLVPVWVALAWHDFPTASTIVGGALIFTGLALRYRPTTAKPSE